MGLYADRFMILLIDFDGDAQRMKRAKSRIPEHLTDKVFGIGTMSEPEYLRNTGFGDYEAIGSTMAQDCRDGTDRIWSHHLLRHNTSEFERLRQQVNPILFRADR